jgi:hypothetical protein
MLLAIAGAMTLASCGGGGGGAMDNGAEKSAVVVGSFAASKSAATSVAAVPTAAGDPITVSVLSDPSISTTVGADGTFTLRGLPSGSFTLVFKQGSTEIGRLDFSSVLPNQQLTITIQLVSNEVVLVDEARTGIGNAGVQLEGPIQNDRGAIAQRDRQAGNDRHPQGEYGQDD